MHIANPLRWLLVVTPLHATLPKNSLDTDGVRHLLRNASMNLVENATPQTRDELRRVLGVAQARGVLKNLPRATDLKDGQLNRLGRIIQTASLCELRIYDAGSPYLVRSEVLHDGPGADKYIQDVADACAERGQTVMKVRPANTGRPQLVPASQ